MSSLYSLRPELEFSTQTQHGKNYLVVKDPVSNRYLRFTENQGIILELIREPIDLDSLAKAAAARFGVPVKAKSLEGLLRSLEQKQLLDTPRVQEEIAEYEARKSKDQNLLYYQLFSLDAERVFEWLFPKVRWCFTPTFHGFAVLIILTGFFISFSNGNRLGSQVASLISVYGFLMIWVVVVCVVTLHEFAHGLTCRYFGGKVRKLGFMLIYFAPALFCDVSDSWMFPKRRDRMWVTFAGGYFQLVIWGLALIVWRIVAEDTIIGQIALIIILFAGLQTLFNFNPLIKLDGYYILSDYLEIPNLRAKAFQAVHAWIAGKAEPLLTGAHRQALLLYGGISLTFSTLLLTVVYVNIFILATSYFEFAGLVGFVMFSGLTIKRTATEPVAGAKALVARAALKKYRNLGIAFVLLLATFLIPMDLLIRSNFSILPNQEAIVRSETEGTVSEIRVEEDEKVAADAVIAVLYDFDNTRNLDRISGELAQKRAELDLLLTGPRDEEVDRAERQVDTKQTELANVRRNVQQRNQMEQTLVREQTELRLADIEFGRTRDLFEAGLGPRVDMEKAETQLEIQRSAVAETATSLDILTESNDRAEDLKERELAEAQSALVLLMAGFRSEEIQQRQAEVQTLESEQKILDDEVKKSTIRAPISGTVVTPFVQRLENKHLFPGDELLRIVDVDTVWAEMLVPEKEMADVRPGSTVTLKVRSYPACDFSGTVDFIAPVAVTTDDQLFVKVRTELINDDPDCALKKEMTGAAKIYGGRYKVIQLMYRRAYRWIRTEFWYLLPWA